MSGGLPGQPGHFLAWAESYGGLFDDRDACWRSLVYGWNGDSLGSAERVVVAEQGAAWGFVERGRCTIAGGSRGPRFVARGRGSCTTPAGVVPLVAGLIFVIPTGGVQGFQTQERSMDVIAYHPDSDYGRHAEAEVIDGQLAVDGITPAAGRRAR